MVQDLERNIVTARAAQLAGSGKLLDMMTRLVSYRTESQRPDTGSLQLAYMREQLIPLLEEMDFTVRLFDNPLIDRTPLLVAERIEHQDLPTILSYGHTDVVNGYEGRWRNGMSPWEMTVEGDRWYGRGTADNKGQHIVNLLSLGEVLKARQGALGFNIKFLFESGEEIDSPGLNDFCLAERALLKADVFIASDGPRVSAERPTLFLGSRGGILVTLEVKSRETAHHSGNWGGILSNPGTRLIHALSVLIGPTGRLRVKSLLPPSIPDSVKDALSDIELGTDDDSPDIDPAWGECSLTPAERVLAWNTLEVLALDCGNASSPVNAIPPSARAVIDFRFVVGTDWRNVREHLEAHLAANGFSDVSVSVTEGLPATRLDPKNSWVQLAAASMQRTSGKKTAILPNFGGTTPNYVFAETLGLPTLWVPHSYPACAQHAPDEHFLASIGKESMAIMAGLWWDLGDCAAELMRSS